MTESKSKPHVYIIAGPNGAGKTTFAKEFLPFYAKCRNFVNADLIAQGISPFHPEAASIKAGKILLKQIHDLAEKKVDFAFETTLAGRSYEPFLRRLKSKGYEIHVYYLWIPDVDLALRRIKDRVAQGGHNIPAVDVRRRFQKSLNHFLYYYRPLIDRWTLINNEGVSRIIAQGAGEHTEVLDFDLYEKIVKG